MASQAMRRYIRQDIEHAINNLCRRHIIHVDNEFPVDGTKLFKDQIPRNVQQAIEELRSYKPTMLDMNKHWPMYVEVSTMDKKFALKAEIHGAIHVPRPSHTGFRSKARDGAYELRVEGTEYGAVVLEWATTRVGVGEVVQHVHKCVDPIIGGSNTCSQLLYVWPEIRDFLPDRVKANLGNTVGRGPCDKLSQETLARFYNNKAKINAFLARASIMTEEASHKRITSVGYNILR